MDDQVDKNTIEEEIVVHQKNVCAPIKSLQEMWAFLKAPPDWITGVIPLKSRTGFVIKNETNDCHVVDSRFIVKRRYCKKYVPRTLVCHDMMNGYLADKFVGGINEGNGYAFYRWPQINVFVYFSHHFLTIPPQSWINLSHKNGVPILGTFITEWKDGSAICKEILGDKSMCESVAKALVDLAVLFSFEGWLINVENVVESPENLVYFLGCLTQKLHEKLPGGLVIWYDSVTKDGELKWQNELNDLNRCYFDVCDGIFLNYTWKEENLARSVQNAKHRLLDVYVGLDVFGRGCFGGGEFNSHLAAKAVREHNLSLAIFGQGWTHERMPKEPEGTFLKRFYSRDALLWKSLWPYLYTHPVKYPFTTHFHTGVKKDHYNLDKQEVQPSFFLSHTYTDQDTLSMGICQCVREEFIDNTRRCLITATNFNESGSPVIHRLFSTEMIVFNALTVVVYTSQVAGQNCDYEILMLVENKFGRIERIICESRRGAKSLASSLQEVGRDSEAIRISPAQENFAESSDIPVDWDRRCFNITFEEYRILEIGFRLVDGIAIHLCGIGFASKQR